MSTQKRRVVYLSDSEWKAVQKWADDQGLTASAYIRQAVSPPVPVVPDPIDHAIARVDQRQRDRILRRINRPR